MSDMNVGDEVDIVNGSARVIVSSRITGETRAFWIVGTSRYRKDTLAKHPQYKPEPKFIRRRETPR